MVTDRRGHVGVSVPNGSSSTSNYIIINVSFTNNKHYYCVNTYDDDIITNKLPSSRKII